MTLPPATGWNSWSSVGHSPQARTITVLSRDVHKWREVNSLTLESVKLEGMDLELSALDLPPALPLSMYQNNVKDEQAEQEVQRRWSPGSTIRAVRPGSTHRQLRAWASQGHEPIISL